MQKAEKRFQNVMRKIKNSNIRYESLAQLEITKKIIKKDGKRGSDRKLWGLLVLVGLFGICAFLYEYHTDECFLEFPFEAAKVFREPVDCDICINVTQVDKVSNISPEDFEEFYASRGRPVVIKDGTKGWKAVKSFSFEFFKNLYTSIGDLDAMKLECQFFPYKTEFKSLAEVLDMSPERARFEPGTKPWYVGWSNCNDEAGKILRNYYSRPYFLPETSEDIALNWMFMGGAGFGAHMHVDDVNYPSWQAQIKGRKTWRFAPAPECLYKCHRMEVTVEPGEIIVADTNRWYHETHILPGSISITIGSEFD